jgi:hypothetical protein
MGLPVEAFSWGEVAGLWSVGLACLKAADQQSGDPAYLCIPWLTGLRGRSSAEWRSCICGSLAWQALGTQACGVNIVWGCAGLGGVAQQRSCRAVQAWGGGCGLAEILNVLSAHPMEILWFWDVEVWGTTGLVGQRSSARGLEIPQRHVEQQLHGLMGWGLAWSTCYSFSIWWCGEASHELGVQNADVLALPDVLSQSNVSPASYQSPWVTEVRRSVAVFLSPSWISIDMDCVVH